MKIKILEIYGDNCYECSNIGDFRITDWDEVTTDEFNDLRDWVYRKNKSQRNFSAYYIIVTHEPSIPVTLDDYRNMIKEEGKVEIERMAKAVSAAKKREKSRTKKELEQLVKLKKKYEN